MKRNIILLSASLLTFLAIACGDDDSPETESEKANMATNNKLEECELLTEGTPLTLVEDECQSACVEAATCEEIQQAACTEELSGSLGECVGKCIESASFSCGDGETVPSEWTCDGDSDCSDGSDEEDCSSLNVFTCEDGETVPGSYACDGEADCENGSDEEGCDTFTCGNGDIVPADYVCDGEADCSDESDEDGCAQFICE